MPAPKRKVEEVPDRLHPPERSVKNSIAQFFWGSAWYERDADEFWYLTGGNGVIVDTERRRELERAWRAEGNVPPPTTEL